MASTLDVLNTIQQTIVPSLAMSTYPTTKVYPGWPDPNTLAADLRGSIPISHISIFPRDSGRLTSRYMMDPDIVKVPATTVVTISSLTATLSGTLTPGDNIFLHINRSTLSQQVLPSDSFNAIIARFCSAINALGIGVTATPSGSSLTLTGTVFNFVGKAFGFGKVITEILRREQDFLLAIWTPDRITGSELGGLVIMSLSGLHFLTFPDTSKGRILFVGSMLDDRRMSAGILRYDVVYSVEFASYITTTAAEVGDIQVTQELFGLDGTLYNAPIIDVY